MEFSEKMTYDKLSALHPDWVYYKIKHELSQLQTHRFSDWFLDFDNTYLYSFHKLMNHIVMETVTDENDDHCTIQQLIEVDMY